MKFLISGAIPWAISLSFGLLLISAMGGYGWSWWVIAAPVLLLVAVYAVIGVLLALDMGRFR